MEKNEFKLLFNQNERRIDAKVIHNLFELFKNIEIYEIKSRINDYGFKINEIILKDMEFKEHFVIPIFNEILKSSELTINLLQEVEERFAEESTEDLVLMELFLKLTEVQLVKKSMEKHIEQFYTIYINLHQKYYTYPISSFWYENPNYLKNFGDTISPIVLNHLIKTIQQEDYIKLDIIINQEFFFLLAEEDIIRMFNSTEVNFFKALAEVYKGTHFIPSDSEFYWHHGNKQYVLDSIKDALILQLQDTKLINNLLMLGLWEALDEYVLRNIPKSVIFYIIEEIFWNRENFWYVKVLDESKEYVSQVVYEKMAYFFRKRDLTPIYNFLRYCQNWFSHLQDEDFEKLVQDKKINLFRVLDHLRRNSLIDRETWEELELLLKYTAPKFQEKLTHDLITYMSNSLHQDRKRMVKLGFLKFLFPINVKKVKKRFSL